MVGSVTFFLAGELDPSGECEELRTGAHDLQDPLVRSSDRRSCDWCCDRPQTVFVIVGEAVGARDSIPRVAILFWDSTWWIC